MKEYYKIGGHRFFISGGKLVRAVSGIAGFAPFVGEAEEVLPSSLPEFSFGEWKESFPPDFVWKEKLYLFKYEDVNGIFGTTPDGYLLELLPEGELPLRLWTGKEERRVYLYGNYSPRLLKFALWIGYGIMTVQEGTVAMHGSCIVYREKAVLFLGESGTGKSTHTRSWREYIPGSELLNDDSPIVRCENGEVRIYGSPWSGKTPCYKPECYPLAGCVRLSQAPRNRICRLNVLQALAALHPSAPPAFAYDNRLYDGVCNVLERILSQVPVCHLACLPDREAAELACHTLYD